MSEHTPTPSEPKPCERLLDYAYDELAGEARVAFEQHLAGCASCQAELAAIRTVRGAVKNALPAVEPPAAASGALHAQLLHAAAQRAGGGQVLPFGRRMKRTVLSPAFLAAAMFVIVGGAAGTMFWRGHLEMPAKQAAAPSTIATGPSVPAEAEEGKPALSPPAEASKEAGSVNAQALDKAAPAATPVGGETHVYLGGKDGVAMPVRRAPAMHASKTDVAEPPAMKNAAVDRKAPRSPAALGSPKGGAAADDAQLDGFADSSTAEKAQKKIGSAERAGATGQGGGSSGGLWNAQPPGAVNLPPATTSSPAPPPAVEPQAPARGSTASYGRTRGEPAAATAAPADGKSLAGPRSSTGRKDGSGGAAQLQLATPAAPAPKALPQQQAYRDLDPVAAKKKNKAIQLADAGRCQEAVGVFSEVLRDRSASLTADERLKYVDCLRQLQRYQQAADELDSLKREKAVTNRAIVDEEQKLQQAREPRAASKMAAPAKPAAEPVQAEQRSAAKGKKAKPVAAPAAADAPAEAKPGL